MNNFNYLFPNYLWYLTHGIHFWATSFIDDLVAGFETDNTLFIEARSLLHTAHSNEDFYWKKFSGKDFKADDLADADSLLNKYVSLIRNTMKKITTFPDSQAQMRRIGEIAYKQFEDFNFSFSESYSSKASKVLQLKDEWTAQQEDLTSIGLWSWIVLAGQQASIVLGLIEQRVEHESVKVKGIMPVVREATDEAVKHLFDVINSMNIMTPSEELTTLTQMLFAIEERVRLYNINNSSGNEPEPTPTPDPTPDPEPEE